MTGLMYLLGASESVPVLPRISCHPRSRVGKLSVQMIFVYGGGDYYFCAGTRSLITVVTEVHFILQTSIKHVGIIRHKDANIDTYVIHYIIQNFLSYFNGNFSTAATKACHVPHPQHFNPFLISSAYKFIFTSTVAW